MNHNWVPYKDGELICNTCGVLDVEEGAKDSCDGGACDCCGSPLARPSSEYPWDCTCIDNDVCVVCWKCSTHCACDEFVGVFSAFASTT